MPDNFPFLPVCLDEDCEHASGTPHRHHKDGSIWRLASESTGALKVEVVTRMSDSYVQRVLAGDPDAIAEVGTDAAESVRLLVESTPQKRG